MISIKSLSNMLIPALAVSCCLLSTTSIAGLAEGPAGGPGPGGGAPGGPGGDFADPGDGACQSAGGPGGRGGPGGGPGGFGGFPAPPPLPPPPPPPFPGMGAGGPGLPPPPPGSGPGLGLITLPLDGVNLTDAQAEKIDALQSATMDKMEPLMAEMRSLERDFKNSLLRSPIDKDHVAKVQALLAAKKQAVDAAMQSSLLATADLLTAEQKALIRRQEIARHLPPRAMHEHSHRIDPGADKANK